MVRTRRQTQVSDSDDDAPEEVQFTSSKADAEQALQAEKDAAQQLKAKKQEQRKEQEAKRQEQKQASTRKRAAAEQQTQEAEEAEAGPSGRQQETPAANGSGYALPEADFLPAEVLEALEQERCVQGFFACVHVCMCAHAAMLASIDMLPSCTCSLNVQIHSTARLRYYCEEPS